MGVEVEVGGVYEQAADLTPTGAIIAFGGTTAPNGWLLCDGTAVNRQTYNNLFEVIGIAFGKGDESSTTFNLPNLQGKFLRGVDHGEGNDPDADKRDESAPGGNTGNAVGSQQKDAFQGHEHSAYKVRGSGGWTNDGSALNCLAYPTSAILDKTDFGEARYSKETRPLNVYVNYIIKY